MTAYPVTCVVDCENGYRTVVMVEDGDVERGSVARLVVEHDTEVKHARIELSPEAASVLVRALQRQIRSARESDR